MAMPVLAPVIAGTLGAAAAVFLAKLVGREWQRINAELDRARSVRVTDPERAAMPKLQRDPTTGIYKPDR
jgi:hypothetical protein